MAARVLLISTYDLGRQPMGLASPAAWLRRDGHEVTCVDASRTPLDDGDVARAGIVAFYLPMHTATRLAMPLVARVRRVNPQALVIAYGLYAQLNASWLREQGLARVLGADAEADLAALAGGATDPPHADGIPRLDFLQPDRSGLPPPARYASLQMPDGSRRVAGSTETTRGCKHLCLHCPIVPVYRGQFRAVPLEVVMRDVEAQVRAGAQHISFGDPDFFNGPTHARRIVERLAAEHAGVTYDATIKVEHLLQHADLLPLLRDTGCLFVTTAVESLDDHVLARLAKGHTRADFERVVALCREHGVTLSPTFVAFTPWTTLQGYLDLVRAVDALDLVEQVAPIQLGIRLLVTASSPLLGLPEVAARISAFDASSLTWPWRHEDPRVDALHAEVMRLVGTGLRTSRTRAFEAIREAAHRAAGGAPPPSTQPVRQRATVPYLDEPWYC